MLTDNEHGWDRIEVENGTGRSAGSRGDEGGRRSSKPLPRAQRGGPGGSRGVASGRGAAWRATELAGGRRPDRSNAGAQEAREPTAHPDSGERATSRRARGPDIQPGSQAFETGVSHAEGSSDHHRHARTREQAPESTGLGAGDSSAHGGSTGVGGAPDGVPGSGMEGESHRGLTPPVYFLAALIAVAALTLAVSASAFSSPLFQVAGVTLLFAGVWLNVRGAGQFESAGTPIQPGSRGGVMVTDGVFRFSRNPMYLGMASTLLGAALALDSAVALLVTPLFVWVIDRGFVAKEESILEDEFGEAYREYRGQVRRWL